MAYQVGGTNRIKDDNTVTFKNVTVKNHYVFYTFQGETSGYHSGSTFPGDNTIDKFSFTSNANATDVGDLTQARQAASSGQSSSRMDILLAV